MRIFGYAALAMSIIFSTSAKAEDFPTKPIRLVVPFAAGGIVDVSGRMVAEMMAEQLKQPVVVENLPGGYGMIAANTVAKAPADGYTLLIDALGIAMNPAMRNAPYDPAKDFEPVGQIMQMPFAIAVNPKLGVDNLDAFIAYAKAHPGELNMASSGAVAQLVGALFGLKAGIDFQTVPYQGGAPATTAVVSGEADFILLDLPNLAQFISSGSLKAFAVSGTSRSPAFPNLPTFSEIGVSGMDIVTWVGIFRPKNVPQDVAQRLEQAFSNAVQSEKAKQFVVARSARPSDLDRPAFSTKFHQEIGLWAQVVKDANIHVE